MAGTAAGKRYKGKPYKPSWLNLFNSWIELLPVSEWFFYCSLALILFLIQILFLWLDNGLQFDALIPALIFNALLIPYLIAFIHFLDHQAVVALKSMRYTLTFSDLEFDSHLYKLSTMPRLGSFTFGFLMMIFLILTESIGLEPERYIALNKLPVFTTLFHIIDKGSAFLMGVFVFHTIRQLHLVNITFANYTRINLFDVKPLYAFSKLTASTATGLMIPVYGWMLMNPELMTNPVGLAGTLVFTILAITVFVLPLVGAHQLMEIEKEKLLRDVELKFDVVFTMFNHRFQDSDDAGIDRLNGIIASLDIQHRKLSAISTWPWKPETIRSTMTAIILPLVLMFMQRFVEQALGW